MKLLIYGSNGWIGNMFIKYIEQHNIMYHRGHVHINDYKEVQHELCSVKPTHVIAFIGRTSGGNFGNIDYLQQPDTLKENIRDNLFAPIVLARLCEMNDVHFTYLGTGCIYSYSVNHGPFTEDDVPNFYGSNYSIVKGYTDQIFHLFDDSVLNLRIRMPISSQQSPRNFINKIIKYEKICSVPNSMTVLETFFPVFVDLMRRKITGTYNCTNPGVISHNEILQMYKQIVDPAFKWINITETELAQILDAKRSNNELNTSRTQAVTNIAIPNIHKAVEETLRNWSKI